MKMRHCQINLEKIRPCIVGWTSISNNGTDSCLGEPIESHCLNIVDVETKCPTCGKSLDGSTVNTLE